MSNRLCGCWMLVFLSRTSTVATNKRTSLSKFKERAIKPNLQFPRIQLPDKKFGAGSKYQHRRIRERSGRTGNLKWS